MKDNIRKVLINDLKIGIAFQKIILDENDKPIDFEFIEVNTAFVDLIGHSERELIGNRATQIIQKRNVDWVEFYSEVALEGKSKFIEYFSHTQQKWFQIYAHSNRKYYFITEFYDISERKHAEELLKYSESCHRMTLENTPNVAIQWYDEEGRVTYWNPASEKLYGWKSEEILGKTLNGTILNPEEAEYFLNTLKEISKTGRPVGPYEIDTVRRDGETRHIFATTFPIELTKNKISYVCMDVDFTERKRAEEELIKAKQKAEESDRLKSAFLANMSHEIRTPMNGILGFISLLQEPGLSEGEKNEYLQIVKESGYRLLNTINDIVDISKIESGLMPVLFSNVAVNRLLFEIYTFFKPETDTKKLEFTFTTHLPDDLAIIETDREKLTAILNNLINNSLKFTKKGAIRFGYTLKGKMLEFFVEDTGIGIEKSKHSKIFERFIQADNSIHSRIYEGTGLGLSISKAYAEMLGGKIWVESEVGKGSKFCLQVPYSR